MEPPSTPFSPASSGVGGSPISGRWEREGGGGGEGGGEPFDSTNFNVSSVYLCPNGLQRRHWDIALDLILRLKINLTFHSPVPTTLRVP